MGEGNFGTVSMKKELRLALDRLNTVRAFCATVFLAILIPVFVLVIHFTGVYKEQSTFVKTFLAICEAFQLLMAAYGYYIISNHELDRLKSYYRIYFFVTGLTGIILGYVDLLETSSILFFLLTGLFISMVPIMESAERRFFTILLAVAMMIFSILGKTGIRDFIDTVCVAVASVVISYFVQEHMIHHEQQNIRLRNKTITSELDPLTGLANRRGLDKKASVLWPYCARTATTLGLIEIDIDFFKKYNDKFGHPAGDRCLRMVGEAIKRSAKRGSDVTARTGGEEFLVFVQGMTEQEMIALAMKIRRSIDELKIPHAYVNISNHVTVSMGVAIMVPSDKNTFQDLYEEADKALYSAKTNGRNCVVCHNKIYGRMKKGLATVITG